MLPQDVFACVPGRAAHIAARLGAVVVSGLALGVDSAAHRAALEAGIPTVAVVGSCVEQPSPASNRTLAEQIVAAGGAIVSEQAPGTRPSAWRVPRN